MKTYLLMYAHVLKLKTLENEEGEIEMNVREKLVWATYLRGLQFKYSLADKVTDKLIELYLEESVLH